MRKFFEKLKLFMLYDGLAKDEYQLITRDIILRNNRNLMIYAHIVAVLTSVLFLASFAVKSIASNRFAYLLVSVVMAVIIAALKFGAKKKEWVGYFINFLFSTLIFAWAMYIGTASVSDYPATSFCVCLVIVPFITHTKVLYGFIQRTIICIAFYLMAVQYKTPDVVSLDITNILAFGILGTMASGFSQRAQASAFVVRYNMKTEIQKLYGLFEIVRIIDLQSNMSVIYSDGEDADHRIMYRNMDAKKEMDDFLASVVSPQSMRGMQQFCELATLEDRLYGRKVLIHDFLAMNGNWVRCIFLTLESDVKGYPTKVSFNLHVLADSYYLKALNLDTGKLQ